MEVERATCVAPATCVALPGGVVVRIPEFCHFQNIKTFKLDFISPPSPPCVAKLRALRGQLEIVEILVCVFGSCARA